MLLHDQIWTKDGSKRIIPNKDLPFGCEQSIDYNVAMTFILNNNNNPKILRLKTPKMEILVPCIWLSSVNDKKSLTISTLLCLHDEWTLIRGWSRDFPQQIQSGGRRPYWMEKMLNISIIDEDICTQFGTKMQHGADYGQQLHDGFQPTM